MENYEIPSSGILRYLLMSGVVFFVGGFLTLLCTIALLIKWIRRSNWRTLPTFVSLIDIAIGTTVVLIHPNVLNSIIRLFGVHPSSEFSTFLLSAYVNCLLFSYCWSFGLPIAVYKELVQINRPIHYAKTIMTALIVGIFVVVNLITIGLQYFAAMYHLSEHFDFEIRSNIIHGIVLLSVIEHLFVILKVSCNKALLKRDGNHSMTLVKVDLIKQIMTLLSTVLMALFFVSFWLHVAGQVLFNIRFLPLAIAAFRYNPATEETKENFAADKGVEENNTADKDVKEP